MHPVLPFRAPTAHRLNGEALERGELQTAFPKPKHTTTGADDFVPGRLSLVHGKPAQQINA
jgi:hypothetical protein